MRSVVFATVLNPVDDTRLYEKMAMSLVPSHDYEIYIIGQAINPIPACAGIQFIPLKPVPRLSMGRWMQSLKIALKLIQLKPELLIVNTHELLIVSVLNRILFGAQIVYDIRENYYRNIRFTEVFPAWLRKPLAWWVRLKEKFTAPLFHHFILAEKSYESELTFLKKRYTVLENKAVLPPGFERKKGSGFNLLFSGTISKSTGIFEALSLAQSMHELEPRVTLTVAGFCALEGERKEIRTRIKNKPYITLKGFDHALPHSRIMDEIARADFGIIYYPPSPHTLGAYPTKLYEYMACQLPILSWENQTYSHLIKEHGAGLMVPDISHKWIAALPILPFYSSPIPGITWEGQKFKAIVDDLFT
ncbi:MAG TPA: hypothetical protein DIS90_05750 [Cytophagales bacterium]|nr:hypothetical protein [Cytophagales bacterium]